VDHSVSGSNACDGLTRLLIFTPNEPEVKELKKKLYATGHEAVDWLLKETGKTGRQEAVATGEYL